MRRAAKVTAVLGAVLLAVGCSDNEQPDPLAPEISAAAAATAEQDAEKAALDELTRLVALAMNDQGLRQRVKNDMRESRHTIEHKLPFSDYLHGNSGGILLAKMAKESGKSRDEILALLEQVRPLEFYMPVPEHRESWQSGSELLVTGSLSEADSVLTAFTPQNEKVSLSRSTPPATPTLVLVPVETDFTQTLNRALYVNGHDNGGTSIGTYEGVSPNLLVGGCPPYPCDGGPPTTDPSACTAAPTGAGVVARRGVSVEEFISCMRTPNDHEPWDLGAPEFYILLAGKHSGGADFSKRINIPESVWAGSDDGKNAQWRRVANPLSLLTWDTDLGTRIKVQCFEDDWDFSSNFNVSGTATYPPANFQLTFNVKFSIGGGDDNCGSSYIDLQNTARQFYYIPDGKNDDAQNPAPPYFNGTSDLQWSGYGFQRI